MSTFNDDNELKHPAFYEEVKEKKKVWVKILDVLFIFCVMLGPVSFFVFFVFLIKGD